MSGQVDIGWAVPPFGLKEAADGRIRIIAGGNDVPALRNQTVRVEVANAKIWKERRAVTERFVQPFQRLGDDDRRLPVGREIHVVGIVYRDRLAWLAGLGIDRRQTAVDAVLGIVGDEKCLQVLRRHDVLRVVADLEGVDDLERVRIDHRYGVGKPIGHIDPRQRAHDRRAEPSRDRLAIEIGRIDHGRHAGHDSVGVRSGLSRSPPADRAEGEHGDEGCEDMATFHGIDAVRQ